MKIPDKVKIGGITYKVEITEMFVGGSDRQGECDPANTIIRVRPGNEDNMWLTFLHELFHAINFFRGIFGDEHDEREIESMAQALAMIISDNPGLLGGDTDAAKTG